MAAWQWLCYCECLNVFRCGLLRRAYAVVYIKQRVYVICCRVMLNTLLLLRLSHCIHCCRVPAGAVDTILSYCHNNLADQTLLDLLPYLHEKGVGVISASFSSMGLLRKEVRLVFICRNTLLGRFCCPVTAVTPHPRAKHQLSQGLWRVVAICCRHMEHCTSQGTNKYCCFVLQGPPDWHPAPAAVKEAASKAAKHAQARGTDLAKLAITEFVRCVSCWHTLNGALHDIPLYALHSHHLLLCFSQYCIVHWAEHA